MVYAIAGIDVHTRVQVHMTDDVVDWLGFSPAAAKTFRVPGGHEPSKQEPRSTQR